VSGRITGLMFLNFVSYAPGLITQLTTQGKRPTEITFPKESACSFFGTQNMKEGIIKTQGDHGGPNRQVLICSLAHVRPKWLALNSTRYDSVCGCETWS